MVDFPYGCGHRCSVMDSQIHSHRINYMVTLLATDHTYYHCLDYCCDYTLLCVCFLSPPWFDVPLRFLYVEQKKTQITANKPRGLN